MVLGATLTGKVYPTLQVAYKSQDVSIACNSAYGAQWTKMGDGLLRALLVTSNSKVLTLKKVTTSSTGIYVCQGKHKDGSPFKAMSSLYVGCMSQS